MLKLPPATYPVRGIQKFCNSKSLVSIGGRVAATTTTISLASLVLLFKYTFTWQSQLVAHVIDHGLLNTAVTSLLILGEGLIPVYAAFSREMHSMRKRVFDQVLKQEGITVRPLTPAERERIHEAAVAKRQAVKAALAREPWPLKTARFVTGSLFIPTPGESIPTYAARLVTVGPLRTLFPPLQLLNSYQTAAAYHTRYLMLKGVKDPDEQALVIEAHKNAYRQFGVVAAALMMVPGLSFLTDLTNSAGAGLWAADMERGNYDLLKGVHVKPLDTDRAD